MDDVRHFRPFMEDCIHLKACRRLQKYAKTQEGKTINSRGCNERCSAYLSKNAGCYVPIEQAVEFARDGVRLIRDGYDKYDVYCECDIDGYNIGEIIEECGG